MIGSSTLRKDKGRYGVTLSGAVNDACFALAMAVHL